MNERSSYLNHLIRLQKWAWYFFFVCFLIISGLFMFEVGVAENLAFWVVIILLLVTVLKLLIIAEQFRVSGLPRLRLLSYSLVVVLLSTIFLKYLFL